MAASAHPATDRTATDDPPAPAARSIRVGGWAAALPPILLAGLAAWGLGRRGFWIDEAISVGATHELWSTLKGTSGTMALYYGALTPWSSFSTDRAWLRSLSVLCTAAALVAVWSAVRRAFGREVALLATTIAAASWLVVRYAQEARSFALALLLTSVAWCALVATARAEDEDGHRSDRSRRWWAVFAVASVVAPLAHGLAVLQFFGQLGFLAWAPDRNRWLRRARPVIVGVVAVSAALVAGGASDIASWIPPLDRDQLAELLAAFTAPFGWGQAVLAALVLVGAVACIRRHRAATEPVERWFALLPLAWAFVPVVTLVVMSIVRPYLVARYVAGSAPGVALLLAFAIVGPTLRPSWRRALPVGLAIAAVLAAGQVHLHRDTSDDWAGAAAIVASGARPGDALVLPNPSLRSAFDYGWLEVADAASPAPRSISPVEPLGTVRRFYRVVAPDALDETVAGQPEGRIWVVDQARRGDSALNGLLDGDAVASAFRVVRDTELEGDVRVVLLERR